MDHITAAKHVVKQLQRAGHIAYFAGGWVRDFIMQHPSDDIDIATSADVKEVQSLFEKTVPVGIAFGIVIVVIHSHSFEVATFRKERGYVDGRRPTTIESASPQEDAQRRDFTINGLFYDPIQDKIYDYIEGVKDIEQGIIRAIGDPIARFQEDKLRMMRAVRYSTRFHFPIEPATMSAITELSSTLFPSVAIERVWQELKKMAKFAHLDTGLITLHQLQLLPTVFPQLKNISLETVQKRVSALPYFPKDAPPIAKLIELFLPLSLQQAWDLCDYLRLSNEEKSFLEFYLHAKHLFELPQEWQQKLEPTEWAYFYAHPHAPITLAIAAAHFTPEYKEKFLHDQAHYQKELHRAILRIQNNEPIVRAQHLIDQGVKPGKTLGFLLKEAEKISINQNIEDRSQIIEQLKIKFPWT